MRYLPDAALTGVDEQFCELSSGHGEFSRRRGPADLGIRSAALMFNTPRIVLVAGLVMALPICASADVTLPALLAEHMVIQRALPVHVWGKAAPDETVVVTFRGETRSTKTDP